jgi:uncharacterized Zn-binding protein involved in type VI secretion
MPSIIVEGDITQGHCWSPTALTKAPNRESNVQAQGKDVLVVGDGAPAHAVTCGDKPNHPITSIVGSPNIFVNGIAVLRDGDAMACGDSVDSAGSTVLCNGGGNVAEVFAGRQIPAEADPNEEISYVVVGIDVTYPTLNVYGNIVAPRDCKVSGVFFTRETFEEWTQVGPFNSNGHVVSIEEEITKQRYLNLQNIGATGLPSAAPEIFKNPLDPYVSYEVLNGPFSITNEGVVTLNSNYIPTYTTNKCRKLTRDPIPLRVKIKYGPSNAQLSKEINVEVIPIFNVV